MNVLPRKKKAGNRFLSFLKGLRPVITYDPLTGAPGVKFEYSSASEYEVTLSALLKFLDDLGTEIYLAFDEFQSIASYEEGNAEAMLRTVIQPLKNIHFIFSGSNKHMMHDIFHSSKRPFFASTRIMSLSAISDDSYSRFIGEKLQKTKERYLRKRSVLYLTGPDGIHTIPSLFAIPFSAPVRKKLIYSL